LFRQILVSSCLFCFKTLGFPGTSPLQVSQSDHLARIPKRANDLPRFHTQFISCSQARMGSARCQGSHPGQRNVEVSFPNRSSSIFRHQIMSSILVEGCRRCGSFLGMAITSGEAGRVRQLW
jgi:hypothetical protein